MLHLNARQSYVVEGSNFLLPKDFPQVLNFDQIFLDAKELDIKDLRLQISQFQQMPTGDLRLLVVNNAQNLSELLQNTLLKAVEEPPSKGVVVLQVASKESLLPTLRSRLEKVFIEKPNIIKEEKELELSGLFSLERSRVLEELEKVMEGLDLSDETSIYRHNLLDRTIRKIRANVNTKLALDALDLNWERESGKE